MATEITKYEQKQQSEQQQQIDLSTVLTEEQRKQAQEAIDAFLKYLNPSVKVNSF